MKLSSVSAQVIEAHRTGLYICQTDAVGEELLLILSGQC